GRVSSMVLGELGRRHNKRQARRIAADYDVELPRLVRRVFAEASMRASEYSLWLQVLENNPLSCEHANESPLPCPCTPDCYCRTRTCSVHGAKRRRR
ncbi:MAG: hypothetical protein ACREI9_12455, partial [Nitrospiraceae bacterium]